MKSKLLLVATSLLAFSTAVHAFPTKPAKCPSVASIAAVGLNKNVVEQDKDGLWVVGMMKHNYDTRDTWTFVVGKINAKNKNDAFQKASASLAGLSFAQGPVAVERINRWACGYNSAAGYAAVSVSPHLDGISLTNVPSLN